MQTRILTLPLILLTVAIAAANFPAPVYAVFGDGAPSEGDPTLVEIQIEGNSRTDENYILREMGLSIGQPLTRERMDEAWDHLEDLGCFAYVDMEFDDFEAGEVVLVVALEEEDTFGYGPRIRYSQRHKYVAGAWAEETNFRGQGETLRADLSVLYIQRAGLTWTRPWFLGQKGLEAEVALRGEQADFVYRPFRYRKSNVEFSTRWTGRRSVFATAGANYGVFQVRDEFSWPLAERGTGSPIGPATVEAETSPLMATRLAIGVDTRSNPWYPSRGIFTQAMIQYWSSPDFDGYTESSLDLRGFVPLPRGHHLLAVRAWGRLTSDAAHLDNVCFFGGAQTVRGHRPGRREGDEAYLLTAEYRLPLTMMRISPQGDLAGVGLHAFADAGDTWFHGADPAAALQSWGVGIHLNMDKVQVRFEAAKSEQDGWTFEFGDVMTF
jgi:outer membrane protein assembly factor BamA